MKKIKDLVEYTDMECINKIDELNKEIKKLLVERRQSEKFDSSQFKQLKKNIARLNTQLTALRNK